MHIYLLLNLALALITSSRSNACGISYALPPFSGNPYSVSFSSDGSILATGTSGYKATLFNVIQGVLSGGVSNPITPGAVLFSPTDGSLLAVGGLEGVTLYNVSGTVLNGGENCNCFTNCLDSYIAFSPDGAYIAAAGGYAGLYATILNIENGQLNVSSSVAIDATGVLAFSPDGKYLAMAYVTLNQIVLFKVASGQISQGTIYALPAGSNGPNSIAFSPNGLYLATGNLWSNDVTLFNVVDGTVSAGKSYALSSGSNNPDSIAFSPDGSLLVTGNGGRTENTLCDITVFQVTNVLENPISYVLPVGSGTPWSIAFSPDGKYVATANVNSNNMTVFDTASFCNDIT